ncbi:TadE/TadG family type IV pilus assembly protein [Rhizobium sp. AU243]|uniref:TadE/TadG family type IV pilus assembly protein n=1 Tax=Rhizobium/Agrobacterium group TaxID=227290 RepID=UPI0010CBAB69|nr:MULTISPECIES: TadE family protein [Rhizobium/Agrobacterium group]NTB95863.1 pilus assembly protein [Agrobacterium tumefaciens]NTC44613.1 pilus assembly protein [Agrobacterium tumefaciens]TKV77154.1 pilus assembly protein [Rhizobium sp. AU243]UXT23828.1 pilus assembly protein [Agrobacterium tumefaciens]
MQLKSLSVLLLRSRSGVAAVEFALLMPVLILVLALAIELGRGWLSYDRFVTLVDNTARWSARFPEFEERVRSGVKSFVMKAGRPLDPEKLDLTLRSAKLVGDVPVTEFPPHNFFGNAENVKWDKVLTAGNFKAEETAIVISGRYKYRPLISLLSDTTIEFEYVTAVNPYFSRHYKYQKGKSDWSFWNVR